jgi:glutamine---fructose-6-phosphate transaminase (isomerizing)
MDHKRGNFTYAEITSQGRTWVETLRKMQPASARLVEFLHKPYSETLLIGCGSTYYLSMASAAIWQSLTQRCTRGRPASELWLFPSSIIPANPSLLVAVSRSGYTTETLRAIKAYKQKGNKDLLVVTCYPEKPMASETEYVLAAEHAGEESVAQTRSFSNMFLLTQIAAGLSADAPEFIQRLEAVPGFFDSLVRKYESLAKDLGEDHKLERFVFLGSNHNYGLAAEGMLKMKEMSLSSSEVFHFMEFRHGPKSVVAPGTLIIGLIHDEARDQEAKVLADMKDLGATTLAIADSAVGIKADYVIKLGTGLDSQARAVLQLPFMQLLAFYHSMSKGLNPDRPENLTAVVEL